MKLVCNTALVCAAVLTLVGACSHDGLSQRTAKLDITVEQQPHYASFTDGAIPTVDLGAVPVATARQAMFRLSNSGEIDLDLSSITITDSAGQAWSVEVEGDVKQLAPTQSARLVVSYRPDDKDRPDYAVVDVASNASNGAERKVRVVATGAFYGAPDIDLSYGGAEGPVASDCEDGKCVVPAVRALSFGNIGLGATGRVELIIRNTAECPSLASAPPCSTCELGIAKNPDAHNVGLGFLPGSNDDGLFTIEDAPALPLQLQQRDLSCSATGELRIMVTFAAPTSTGEHSAVLVIESNDPDEGVIELPVRASAIDGPVAVAKLRAADPGNPSAPFSVLGDIAPLDRVYFDGRDSYDPRDPSNPSLIAAYRWEVLEYPDGASPTDFAPQGSDGTFFSFWLPLAGHYVVRLTVTNVDGLESGDTESARFAVDAVPKDRLHVQLVWDNPNNDQDVHLVYLDQGNLLCSQPWDCYWDYAEPQWFSDEAPGTGGNPRLDIDDTTGLGPENIDITAPRPGHYRIYVHYYWDDTSSDDISPTRDTLRIYVDGLQTAEYRRTLNQHDVWAVADVTWNLDGTATITPYPSDAATEPGTVSNIQDSFTNCQPPGWLFQ